MSDKLVEIRGLSKVYRIGGLISGTKLRAVDQVNLSLAGERPAILSIVGESGSGKTTLARMMLRLVEPSEGEAYIGGRHLFSGRNRMSNPEFRRFVQPIFQNPFESFSLHRPVDSYLYETAINLGIAPNRRAARDLIARELLSVGLDIEAVAGKYPNQFSGGELQRISVARALIPKPKLIIADEPVSMIDASLRMNLVNLFRELKATHQVSFLYITHDLSTAYYVSDYIAIMYRGNVVEYGPAKQILTQPEHPYTELLMESVPKIGVKWRDALTLPHVESRQQVTSACKFVDRCPYARHVCREHVPPMVELGEERRALCFRPVQYETGR